MVDIRVWKTLKIYEFEDNFYLVCDKSKIFIWDSFMQQKPRSVLLFADNEIDELKKFVQEVPGRIREK